MNTGQIVGSVITFLLSIFLFIVACRQFKQKGFLFNNAYIFASDEERANMNKKPYYKQSAIVSLGLGIIFLLLALTIITEWSGMFFIILGVSILVIIFTIVSSVIIKTKYH